MKAVVAIFSALILSLQAPTTPRGGTGGVVTGRIQSKDGSPVAGVRVQALSADSGAGDVRIVGLAETDGTGRFRLEDIPPGRYYIAAGLLELPTYYPGIKDLARSTILTVRPGTTLPDISFTLAQPQGVWVRGKLTGVPSGTPAGVFRATLIPTARTAGAVNVQVVVGADGTFEFAKVMPGNYSLRVLPGTVSSQQTIEVKEDDVALEMPAGPVVLGRVTVVDGSSLPVSEVTRAVIGAEAPSLVVIGARRADSGALSPLTMGTVRADGVFLVPPSFPSGEYTLDVRGPFGYFIVSMTYAGADLQRVPFKMPPAPDATGVIQIVLSSTPPAGTPAGFKVSGRIVVSSGTADGMSVSLQPAGAGSVAIGGRMGDTAVGPDGAFEFLHVPPGTYSARVVSRASPGSGSASAVTVTDWDVTGIELQATVPAPITSAGALPSNPPFGQPAPSALQPPSYPAGVTVSGRVVLAPGASGVSLPRGIVLFGSRDALTVQSSVKADGRFEAVNVQPGTYDVRTLPLSMTAPATRIVVSGVNLSGVTIQAPSEIEVRGEIVMENGGRFLAEFFGVTVHLQYAGGSVASAVQNNGSFSTVIEPGNYTVSIIGLPDGYRARSISAAGTELRNGSLRVDAPTQIRITLSAGSDRGVQ